MKIDSIVKTPLEIISEISLMIGKKLDPEKEYVCDLKLYRKKRSLDANAYFHVLVDKLRLKLDISFAHCKNALITSYGQIEYLDEDCTEALIYKTNAPPEYVKEREEVHMLYLKEAEENGRSTYFYRLYRGSHTYNTWEMSRLIEGTVAECQDEGIETLTPDELQRMMEMYDKSYKRRIARDDVSKEAEV